MSSVFPGRLDPPAAASVTEPAPPWPSGPRAAALAERSAVPSPLLLVWDGESTGLVPAGMAMCLCM